MRAWGWGTLLLELDGRAVQCPRGIINSSTVTLLANLDGVGVGHDHIGVQGRGQTSASVPRCTCTGHSQTCRPVVPSRKSGRGPPHTSDPPPCQVCRGAFTLAQYNQCLHHPAPPLFRDTGNMGVYPCCGASVLRFDPCRDTRGCQGRKHVVDMGGLDEAQREALRLAERFTDVICQDLYLEEEASDAEEEEGEDEKSSSEDEEEESVRSLLNSLRCFCIVGRIGNHAMLNFPRGYPWSWSPRAIDMN